MTEPNNDSELLQARIERLEAREQQRAKRTRRFIAMGIACALATPFAVRALGAVPHVFSSGDLIVAAEINENFAHVVGGVTAVEADLAARPTGLYCGSASSNGAFMSGTLRGFAAARDLCRTACGGSPTGHMCTVSEATVSFQFGLLPVGTQGWITGGGSGDTVFTECADASGAWRATDAGNRGRIWVNGSASAVNLCDLVLPVLCCD